LDEQSCSWKFAADVEHNDGSTEYVSNVDAVELDFGCLVISYDQLDIGSFTRRETTENCDDTGIVRHITAGTGTGEDT